MEGTEEEIQRLRLEAAKIDLEAAERRREAAEAEWQAAQMHILDAQQGMNRGQSPRRGLLIDMSLNGVSARQLEAMREEGG